MVQHSHRSLLLLVCILTVALITAPSGASPVWITHTDILPNYTSASTTRRDAHTLATDPNGDPVHLTSLSLAAPQGAVRTSYRVGGGDIVTFRGKTPTRTKAHLARRAYIAVHGVERDGALYWKLLDAAWHHARKAGITEDGHSIRLAPNFLSTKMDAQVRTGKRLGWGDQDGWAGGDGATAPAGATASLAPVLDHYLDSLSDLTQYPQLDTVVFVGHGAGAQAVQRYAVLGKDAPRASLKVRYVVANPSTNLYFTVDRPRPVDPAVCPYFNDFRYGLQRYASPYPKTLGDVQLFRRYLSRDVRYLVGERDTKSDEGDQHCAAIAAGGPHRRDRNLDYWAYLHLLSGREDVPVPAYAGLFPALDPTWAKAARSKATVASVTGKGGYPVSNPLTLAAFRTPLLVFNHQLTLVPDVGHSAHGMLRSVQGLRAVFGE